MNAIKPKGSIVGREVYDKVNHLMGTVVREDGIIVVIEISDGETSYLRTVTNKVLKRCFKLVKTKEEQEQAIKTKLENRKVQDRPVKGYRAPEHLRGEVGCGKAMSKIFLDLVKYNANQDLQIITNKKNTNFYRIKYNNFTIFECYEYKRRFLVLAHSKSISPFNKKYITKEYDKSTNWVLRSEFIFTDESQRPIMKSIIIDGLYYRQIAETIIREGEQDGKN